MRTLVISLQESLCSSHEQFWRASGGTSHADYPSSSWGGFLFHRILNRFGLGGTLNIIQYNLLH